MKTNQFAPFPFETANARCTLSPRNHGDPEALRVLNPAISPLRALGSGRGESAEETGPAKADFRLFFQVAIRVFAWPLFVTAAVIFWLWLRLGAH